MRPGAAGERHEIRGAAANGPESSHERPGATTSGHERPPMPPRARPGMIATSHGQLPLFELDPHAIQGETS
jgi:hypothetical protein